MARITVIDDDVDLATMLAQFLTEKGHDVTVLNDTAQAVAELQANTPDLIMLDVMFPEDPSAGMSLAIDIRNVEKLAKLPIIMLTNINQEFPTDFSEKDIDENWLPVTHFIEKPLDLCKIDALLGKCLPA